MKVRVWGGGFHVPRWPFFQISDKSSDKCKGRDRKEDCSWWWAGGFTRCAAQARCFCLCVIVGEVVLGKGRCLSRVQVGRVGKKGSCLSGFGRDPMLSQGQLGRQGCRVRVGHREFLAGLNRRLRAVGKFSLRGGGPVRRDCRLDC